MKLIVGLGNPGKEYQKTRHNIGFDIIDNYLENVIWKDKYQSLIYKTILEGENVIFVKPQTFMNLSGNAIRKIVEFYDINPKDILVIRDDVDLPVGKIKIKLNSSSGGHNGIKNIIDNLKSQDFYQFKIGVGNNKCDNLKFHVLNKLTQQERKIINENISKYFDVINMFIKNKIEQAMNKYN